MDIKEKGGETDEYGTLGAFRGPYKLATAKGRTSMSDEENNEETDETPTNGNGHRGDDRRGRVRALHGPGAVRDRGRRAHADRGSR